MRRRSVAYKVLKALQAAGVEPTVKRSKHVKFTWEGNDRNWVLIVGDTSGCPRAERNALADVRRLLTKSGFTP